MDVSKFIEKAKKGSFNAIYLLGGLNSYDNPAAKEALKKLDLTDIIKRAQAGDVEAFLCLSSLVFQNARATLAMRQLDLAKLMDNIDFAKDKNAEGKMMVIAMWSQTSEVQAIMLRKYQSVDLEALLMEANKGNNSALNILLARCRQKDKRAMELIKQYDPAELVYSAKSPNRASFFNLVDLWSFNNPLAQKAFQENDFAQIAVNLINKGNSLGVEWLKVLVNRKMVDGSTYTKINTDGLVQKVNQGQSDAVSTLVELDPYSDNQSVWTKINPQEFVNQATEGSHHSIEALISLYRALRKSDNSKIKNALVNLNPEQYVEALREGDSSAAYSLRCLAVQGNHTALEALVDLAQEGNITAKETLQQSDVARLVNR